VPASIDIAQDPFNEHGLRELTWRGRVLGARCEFSSDDRELLGIAEEAFARVPQHRGSRDTGQTLRITLRRVHAGVAPTRALPPSPRLSSGAGLLFGHIDSRSFAVIDPRAARALVQVDSSLLRHRQLVRYELIEFATVTLATRARELVPLHAGCVGADGRGVLLLGASGSGKSTLALHSAFAGLEFLAEDSVFVEPATLRATGLSAFVHARGNALGLIEDSRRRQIVRSSPRILRRSGVRKHEIDLRQGIAHLARAPLRIVAAVVLSARRARDTQPLVRLTTTQLRRVLRSEQPYAVDQPGWREFERRLLSVGGYRLDRTTPESAVAALRALLEEAT
jgi:hypothetical protein